MSTGAWRRGPDQDPIPPPGHDGTPSSATTPTRPDTHIIRPMPSAARAACFEDLARRPLTGDAEGPSRFEPPQHQHQAGRSGAFLSLPIKGWVTLALAMIVLGVSAGVLWVSVFGAQDVDDSASATLTGSIQSEHSSPREVVLGYLSALADGRAEDALAFGPPPSTEHSTLLLAQSSFDAMPAESRPSSIRILTEDPLATDVTVEYKISGELVSTTIRTERRDDDTYALERTTVTVQLLVAGSDNLPVLLNGVRIDPGQSLAVLPGTYSPSTGLPLIDFMDADPLEIPTLVDSVEYPVNPELTPTGRAGFVQAAQTSLDRCIDSGDPAPTGCPNAIVPPRDVVPGSVTWELQKPGVVWELFTPALSPEDQTVATATLGMQLSVAMDFTDGQGSSIDDIFLNVPVSATMEGEDPASISVVWGG